MKIAFNAIRVSNKAGSGFDTFIINFVNEFAKYVYENPQLNIVFDVFTLYPHHFPEVKKENIKQVKLPFLRQKVSSSQTRKENGVRVKKKLFFPFSLLTPIYHLLSAIYFTFADYFRMFWTQFVFPFYALRYDLVVAMTQIDVSIFCRNQSVIVHDLIPFIFPRNRHKHKWFLYKILSKIVKELKFIFTVSKNTKSDIMRLFNVDENKVEIIYEGSKIQLLDLNNLEEIKKVRQKYGINEDFLLFVGGAQKHKNLSLLIKAFHLVLQKINNIILIVIGYFSNDEKKFFDKEIKSLNLTNKIKFLGHIGNNELRYIYTFAKLFVFPTLYEGFGLPPLEAMSCGCPVVVSDKGSLPEVCGNAAVYVNPYDPKDIADGILKVLTDKNLQAELVKKGFEQVKKFTWENTVKKFVEVLKNLQNNGIN